MKPIRPVKLTQFGVRFVKRGPNDPHVCVQLISEDDGRWYSSMGDSFSSHWLTDMIRALELARARLGAKAIPSKDGFGWQFRE